MQDIKNKKQINKIMFNDLKFILLYIIFPSEALYGFLKSNYKNT